MKREKAGVGRKFLARGLAAAAIVGAYCLVTVGTASIVTLTGATSAEARGGHGGHGGRGFGGGRRFYGGGGGYYRGYYPYYGYYNGGCYWSRRYGRRICPYYY